MLNHLKRWLERILRAPAATQHSKPEYTPPKPKGCQTGPLPKFTYYPDPQADGAIVKKTAVCDCCELETPYVCPAGIYSLEDVETICPWCVANGRAAEKFKGSFHDLYSIPDSIPPEIVMEIDCRTPGYETWQGNHWLFSDTDAMIFLGEIDGKLLRSEGNEDKLATCLEALSVWKGHEWSEADAFGLVKGGQPSVYLFQDRATGAYSAYSDMG